MSIRTYLAHLWTALCGQVRADELILETDAGAELRQLHARIATGLRYLKDIPMALIDDIAALKTAETNALAAKDAASANTVQELATANQTIASLQAEITAAQAAVVAQTQALTPAPAATVTPAIDPTTGLPVQPVA